MVLRNIVAKHARIVGHRSQFTTLHYSCSGNMSRTNVENVISVKQHHT
jgi:hypothetical protein